MDFSTNAVTITTIIFFALFFPAATTADEEAALLTFRQSSIDLDPSNYLQSWTTAAGKTPTPCSWTGVSCSNDGRVTGLNLNNYGLTGSLRIGDLMALPSLQYISLQGNAFSGNLSYPAGTNCSFVSVDLSANCFSDTILGSFLTECKGLVELNMSRNSIPGGIFPFGSSIQRLDLSGNKIADSGLLSFSLSNCRSLRYLNFSDNLIPGKLRSVSACTNLEALDLSYNFFVDEIPAEFFSGLPLSLTQLFLSKSNFTGDFSKTDFGICGGNVTALDVSSNLLTGVGLPPSLLNCRLLQSLDLSGNCFNGSIPGFVANLTSLKHLSLANNNYTGAIPPELSGLCRSLLHLDLSSNSLTGGLPSSFIGCSSIQRLNLGSNKLFGDFINTVVSAIPSLTHLLLPFNNISGGLPLPSLKNSTLLEVIDLSSNDFTGPIPVGFCFSLPSLQKILLQDNYLNGTIPVALAECTNLITINLSFNELSGAIPPEIFALPKLTEFISWANTISGELPDVLCSTSTALEILILNHNMITGSIPPSITKCPNLAWLSLSGNRLTGAIPVTVGDLQKLALMQLANNSLTSAIPAGSGSWKALIWLDLYSNKLSGEIPVTLAASAGLVTPNNRIRGRKFAFLKNEQGSTCPGFGDIFEFSGIRPERFSNHPFIRSCPTMRVFTGLMDPVFTSNGSVLYLDLSHNSLTGPIPDNFGNMSYLQVLNLGDNQLTGSIPHSFGRLKSVGILDLSHNNLSGGIPGELGSLSFLGELDVSYNNLSGPIPSSGQLITYPESQFVGNPGLCGLPLLPCVSEVTSQTSNSDSGGKERLVGVSVLVGIGISAFIILVLVFVLFRVKSNHRTDDMRNGYIESLPTTGTSTWKLDGVLEPLSVNVSTFEKQLRKLTFAHLLEATNGFSEESMIGSGGFGEVYRALLKDGNVVAIKKLVHATSQGDREFVAEMETIGKIKHRHLVPLLGYCKVGEERLLVYEYMKHGSLDNVLLARKEKGALDLDWATRKKIAVGSARGLAFLHHSCIPHIIHRDMKSSNVLIDDGLEARVSDFGMARLMNAVDTHLSVSSLAGTPGYVPPEYYQSFRCTTKGDVYSYGVVLLELLTGKKPIDSNEFGDNNLVGWAKQLVKENRFGEIIDSDLLGHDPDEEADIFRFLTIACDCLEDTPLRRPTMGQVLSAFKEIQGDSADSDVFQP